MTDLTLLIVLFFANCLEIFGFYGVTKEGQILELVGLLSDHYLGVKISKAVCNCPPCMASLHSLIVWIPIYCFIDFTWGLIYVHIFYIFALSGLNKLIVSLKGIDL